MIVEITRVARDSLRCDRLFPRITLNSVALTVLRRSTMTLPPFAHHLRGDLAGIAERPRLRCDDLVSILAQEAIQVFRLIRADAPTTITRLAFLHYALANSVVRQMLQRLWLYTWEVRVERGCLSVER